MKKLKLKARFENLLEQNKKILYIELFDGCIIKLNIELYIVIFKVDTFCFSYDGTSIAIKYKSIKSLSNT